MELLWAEHNTIFDPVFFEIKQLQLNLLIKEINDWHYFTAHGPVFFEIKQIQLHLLIKEIKDWHWKIHLQW